MPWGFAGEGLDGDGEGMDEVIRYFSLNQSNFTTSPFSTNSWRTLATQVHTMADQDSLAAAEAKLAREQVEVRNLLKIWQNLKLTHTPNVLPLNRDPIQTRTLTPLPAMFPPSIGFFLFRSMTSSCLSSWRSGTRITASRPRSVDLLLLLLNNLRAPLLDLQALHLHAPQGLPCLIGQHHLLQAVSQAQAMHPLW